ncbi:MAG: hypothetical protein LBR68_01255, partial [Lachnoclostridium sp.]|nr:hypothetical protein [Lachnoclostridium sp.]
IPNTEAGIPDKALYQIILSSLGKKADEVFTVEEALKITKISFFGNQQAVMTLSGIEYLSNLSTFYVANTQIASLQDINKLPKLTSFSVGNSNLMNLHGIETMFNLKELGIYRSKIVNFREIENLINLKSLTIEGAPISNLQGIQKLVNLELLNVRGCNLSSAEGVEELVNLKTLVLTDNELRVLPDMTKLVNLEQLSINYNYLSADEIKAKVPERFRNKNDWMEVVINVQNVRKQLDLVYPKTKSKITKNTTKISGKTHPHSIVRILQYDKENSEPIYETIANDKGEFTFNGLRLKKYRGKKLYLYSFLITHYVFTDDELSVLKTMPFKVNKLKKVKKSIRLIRPKNKSKLSAKTKRIKGKTFRGKEVRLETVMEKIVARTKINKKGIFTLRKLNLDKYRGKTLYICGYAPETETKKIVYKHIKFKVTMK